MKKFSKICLILAVCILMTACSNKSGEKKTQNHFTFATWAAGKELEEFEDIIKRVNEKADGKYVIEVQSIPSDYYVKISTQIAGKRSPDFFWMTQELISKYADLGAIADLTKAFSASESLKPDQYYEGVLASASYEGSYWGLPWIANPLMVYYNKTMFEQLGIPCPSPTEPWTWEEFIETARKLTGQKNYKNEPVYGYIVDGWPNIETFLWAGGGDIIAEDGETILLDSEESIKGMGYLKTIISEGLTPKYAEVASLGSNNVWFEKQRAAMFTGGLQDNFEEKIGKLDQES